MVDNGLNVSRRVAAAQCELVGPGCLDLLRMRRRPGRADGCIRGAVGRVRRQGRVHWRMRRWGLRRRRVGRSKVGAVVRASVRVRTRIGMEARCVRLVSVRLVSVRVSCDEPCVRDADIEGGGGEGARA